MIKILLLLIFIGVLIFLGIKMMLKMEQDRKEEIRKKNQEDLSKTKLYVQKKL